MTSPLLTYPRPRPPLIAVHGWRQGEGWDESPEFMEMEFPTHVAEPLSAFPESGLLKWASWIAGYLSSVEFFSHRPLELAPRRPEGAALETWAILLHHRYDDFLPYLAFVEDKVSFEDVADQVDATLAILEESSVSVLERTPVREYLVEHSDMLPALEWVCQRTVARLGPECQFRLELFRDPEANASSLVLNVRSAYYPREFRQTLATLRTESQPALAVTSGDLLVSTDYQPLGSDDQDGDEF